jgi:hypothetical protein
MAIRHQDMVEKLYKNFTFYEDMDIFLANISKGTKLSIAFFINIELLECY